MATELTVQSERAFQVRRSHRVDAGVLTSPETTSHLP
jgi:hypothetical protein